MLIINSIDLNVFQKHVVGVNFRISVCSNDCNLKEQKRKKNHVYA